VTTDAETDHSRPDEAGEPVGQGEPVELVLPLVVRIERADPPTRTDALEAAAQAVLAMLTADEPEWQDAIRAWDGGRIRKVVRRARGAEWRRASEQPGRTITHGSAEVRVYPPIPIDGWPPELAKLQVGGTELDDPEPPGDPAGEPLILVSPHVRMSAGKAMAQVGHAAQLGWRVLAPEARAAWQHAGFPLAVRTATPEQWRTALADGAAVVHDAGFTEVAPNSETAAFVG
jgi:peptidyl-tRNA hydrolase